MAIETGCGERGMERLTRLVDLGRGNLIVLTVSLTGGAAVFVVSLSRRLRPPLAPFLFLATSEVEGRPDLSVERRNAELCRIDVSRKKTNSP